MTTNESSCYEFETSDDILTSIDIWQREMDLFGFHYCTRSHVFISLGVHAWLEAHACYGILCVLLPSLLDWLAIPIVSTILLVCIYMNNSVHVRPYDSLWHCFILILVSLDSFVLLDELWFFDLIVVIYCLTASSSSPIGCAVEFVFCQLRCLDIYVCTLSFDSCCNFESAALASLVISFYWFALDGWTYCVVYCLFNCSSISPLRDTMQFLELLTFG